MTTRMLFTVAAALGALVAQAGAEPYWLTYEGNDLPENEGWTRYWGNQDDEYQGDGAIRTLEDGVLTIDTLHDPWIYDYNWIDRPGEFDPEPGELLVMEWRLEVDEVVGVWCGPGVSLASDERWRAGFAFHEDYIWSFFEDDVFIPITPGVFHEYRFVSSDLRSYELYIDGELARQGAWGQFASSSRATWGDFSYPVSSRSRWDYFRFGVVPEPSALWLFVAGLAACVLRTVRSGMRRVVLLPVLAYVLAASATAEPYWIAYEGNGFPENEGWWRVYSGGGAERWIEDGMLVLDGLADLGINDVYGYDQYPIDPGPAELFVAEFRFAIDEIISGPDPGFGLFSDESWAVGFSFSDDLIRSGFEQETFDFNFTGFHTFRLTSSDMRNYTLEADGEVIREGVFHHVISASQLRWGDSIEGGASLTRWDYMRSGVIPEPCTLILAFITTLTLAIRQRR